MSHPLVIAVHLLSFVRQYHKSDYRPQPLVAAILNFAFNGLGYLYAKKKVPLGIAVVVFTVVSIYFEVQFIDSTTVVQRLILAGYHLTLSSYLAYDVYRSVSN